MQRKTKSNLNKNSSPVTKGTGLFDHIKHIQYIRDPAYYTNLNDEEKKTFNLFMILRGLSMNPSFIEYASYLYRFLDTIPPAQFYKVILELYPKHKYKEFHPWVKSKKNKNDDEVKKHSKIVDLIVQKFEISRKEAGDYYIVFNSNKDGKEFLFNLIQGFGYSEKEVEKML